MSIESDILYRDTNDLYGSLKALTEIQATFVGILFNQMNIDTKKKMIPSDRILEFLNKLIEDRTLEEYHPTIYSQPAWILNEANGNIYFEEVPHYFLVCDDTGAVIDLFAWRLDIPLNYKDSTMTRYVPPTRSNPFGENYYYSDTTPIVLWLAVRAIFLGKEERRKGETRDAFINRVYRAKKRVESLSRKEALGKAYAIAVSHLQKEDYLKSGTRFVTEKGRIRGLELAEYFGEKGFDDHFKDFEAIVRLSRGVGK
jgi:hypothetical protein